MVVTPPKRSTRSDSFHIVIELKHEQTIFDIIQDRIVIFIRYTCNISYM